MRLCPVMQRRDGIERPSEEEAMWELIEGLLEFIVLVIAGVFEVRA